MPPSLHRAIALAILGLALGAPGPAPLAAPQNATTTYQGRLNQNGAPLNGNVNLDLRLYDAATGGLEIARFDGPELQDFPVTDGLLQVELPFDVTDFDGNERWLEIRVNGSILSPRQRVASTPYAARALGVNPLALDGSELQNLAVGTAKLANGAVTLGKLGANSVDGSKIVDGSVGSADINATQVQRRVTGTCGAGQAVAAVGQDGSVNCVNAGGWSLAGNAGTDPTTQFLGTTDAQPLVLRVDNEEVLRLRGESAQIDVGGGTLGDVSGSSLVANANVRPADAVSAVVLGGGAISVDGTPVVERNAVVEPADASDLPSHFVTVSGGLGNEAAGFAATIGGGYRSVVDGFGAMLGGGSTNQVRGDYAAVAGGRDHVLDGFESFIGGGTSNQITAPTSVIAGGSNNEILSGSSAIVGGGDHVIAAGTGSAFIGGGQFNRIEGTRGTVAGGYDNIAGSEATVAGGASNHALGSRSTVPGGFSNCAGGLLSFAAGNRAKIRRATGSAAGTGACSSVTTSGASGDLGTFVWADSQSADFTSTGSNRFLVRAQGGIWLGTTSTPTIAAGRFIDTSTGAYLTSGGTWTNSSSRERKSDLEPVDAADALARVLALPLYTWRYDVEAADVRHMGPMAEDFHAAFELNGAEDKSISTVDADGVALAAIQGLHAELQALRARVETLERENRALRGTR
jgi:hypothetical protein